MSNAEKGINPDESISAVFYDETGKTRVRTEEKTKTALLAFEAKINEAEPIGLPAFLRRANEEKVSPTSIARQAGVSPEIMIRVYGLLGIQKLPSREYRWTKAAREQKRAEMNAAWKDPKYSEPLRALRQSDGYRKKLGQSHKNKINSDPEYKARIIASITDPKAMANSRAAIIARWSDPAYKAKMSEAARSQMISQRQDPEFIELVNRATSQMMKDKWKTKEFREKMQSVTTSMWENSAHREQVSLFFNLHSVYGNRRDLDFYALSTWEANLGRVLKLLGCDYYTREIFTLTVTPDFSDLFNTKTTSMAIDFVAVDPNGQATLYEIMARPLENPIGWAKLTMLMKQRPDLDITAMTPDKYKELTRTYAAQIEASGDFCGWETTKDNLFTNPEKYLPLSE